MAQSLLQYRVNLITGAERNARERNESGARFPWESARTGEETATYGPCGDRELHVNGDIAFAVWQYWRALGDNSGGWLEETAWPLLSGISAFWMSRLAADNAGAAPGAALSINDVMCPDEYADRVNNSAFTNVVARYTLQHAAAVAQLLGLSPANYTPWLDAAARIVLQPFDDAQGFTPEFDGYKSGSTIKQADVILLGYPFEEPSMNAATRAANLKYYSRVTDGGGPAMTCKFSDPAPTTSPPPPHLRNAALSRCSTGGMFAIGYIELGAGFEALAAANFNRSFANAQLPFLVWTETPTGGTPNFITGAGGFLQTAYFGYSGLRVRDENVTIAPSARAPELTTVVELAGVAYRGSRLIYPRFNSSITFC